MLKSIPHCKDHRPEACKLIPADRYHSSQGCNTRDDKSYRVHAHYHVQDLLKDYPSLESYDGRIGCDVICRDSSYNRQKPLAILHKEIEDTFENSEELLKHLTHQLEGRDEIRLYYVVDAKQSGRCLTLELVKSTGHSLRHRINHIVELTARTRSLFECLSNKVCGYRTLAHLILEGRYRLTCKLRDIEQRVISCVDELEKVLTLQFTCRRDLTEDKRKALQLVLVTHGDISEHLEVFRDGFCGYAKAHHGLCCFLNLRTVPYGLVGVFVKLSEELCRCCFRSCKDAEGCRSLLCLHSKLCHRSYTCREGNYRVGKEGRTRKGHKRLSKLTTCSVGQSLRCSLSATQSVLNGVDSADDCLVTTCGNVYYELEGVHFPDSLLRISVNWAIIVAHCWSVSVSGSTCR